jgi:hypothetical protein
MKIKIAVCLLILTVFSACSSVQMAQRQTLEQRLTNKYAVANTAATAEPAPPAEGPDDVPADMPGDPMRNPKLVPTPLLRLSAASSTP